MIAIDILSLLVGLALVFPPSWLLSWVNVVDGRYVYAALCLFGGVMLTIATVHMAWVEFAGGKTREEQPMIGGPRSPLDDK